MFGTMLRRAVIASAVTLPLGWLSLAASAAMPQTEQDYVPKHPVNIDRAGVVHHGPLDCVGARKIVREEGYRNIDARNCSGEVYLFRAERHGRVVHLRVHREDGRVTRG
jgi:hypothetical protein